MAGASHGLDGLDRIQHVDVAVVPQARRPSGVRTATMPFSGSPVRSCMTVAASTVTGPSQSSHSSTEPAASTASCGDAQRNEPAGGGSVE